MRLPASITLACLGALNAACSAPADPLHTATSARHTDDQRLRAIAAAGGHATPDAVGALSRVLWDRGSRARVRIAAFHGLLSLPGGEPPARQACVALLPSEPDRAVVASLAQAAASRAWTEVSAALVRSLSRPWRGVPDASRPEAVALSTLHPDQDLFTIAWASVNGQPSTPEAYPGVDRLTVDAWNLLSRIDPTGAARRRRVGGENAALPVVLRSWAPYVSALPSTGEELAWMARLHSPSRDAWRRQAWAAMARRGDTDGARHIRHAEPLRWVASSRPLWLELSTDQLQAGLEQSLSARRHSYRQSGLGSAMYSEALEGCAGRLTRADLLTILALDDAVRSPDVAASLFEQARLDRADRTTEYGGLLIAGAHASGSGDGVVARLFPPRPGERLGDQRFVASDDMLAAGDLALAHYHFHAQGGGLAQACGPSSGDLDYARRFGVNGIVLTARGDNRMGVDYYQPDGTVLDLGDLTLPRP